MGEISRVEGRMEKRPPAMMARVWPRRLVAKRLFFWAERRPATAAPAALRQTLGRRWMPVMR